MDANIPQNDTLEARAPLIDAVAHLHQLTPGETDTLCVMDQLCRSPAGCAFAERYLKYQLKDVTRCAFTMVSPQWARRMHAHDNSLTLQDFRGQDYLASLCQALLLYPGLNEAARAVAPDLQQQIAEQLLSIWQELYADDPNCPEATYVLKPVLHLLPASARPQLESLNLEVLMAQEHAEQRRLISAYLAGEGPLDIARVAPAITDSELRALAAHPTHASIAILTELEIRHGGPDVMLEAYMDSLFSPGAGMHGRMPQWVRAHPRAFLDRLMQRLEQNNAKGVVLPWDWQGLNDNVMKTVLEVAEPQEMVALCLGSRTLLSRQKNGAPTYAGHPVTKVRKLARFSPLAGQWGPVIKRILDYLKDRPIDPAQRYLNEDQESALSFLLTLDDKYQIHERKLFQSCGLRQLTTKQCLDDLAYPIDAHSRVIDHIPTLMAYVERLVWSCGRGTSENVEKQLRKQFASIESGFMQQAGRLLKVQLKAEQPRSERALAESMTHDVL